MPAIIDKDSTRVGELLQDYAETFKVRRTTIETIEVRKGWGVVVNLVYAGDDEPNPDEPVAFDACVVEIDRDACTFTSDGTFCVRIESNYFVPVENFGDDENDLAASRYFETEQEAKEHVEYVSRALSFAGLEAY